MKRSRQTASPDSHASSGDLRQLILNAARRLFILHGYHGLAMRQIAEAVGVTKPALYYHFTDKEALFLSVLEEYLDAMQPLLDGLLRSAWDTRTRIAKFIEALLSQPAEQRALIHLASQEAAHLSPDARQRLLQSYDEHFLSKIRLMLEQGMQQGELRRLDVQVAAWVLLGILYPYFSTGSAAQLSPEHMSEVLVAIFLHGMEAGQ